MEIVRRAFLIGVVWGLFFPGTIFAEIKTFPEFQCSIELPDSISWQVLKREQISKKETFFSAVSPETSNLVAITLQPQPVVDTEKAAAEYIAGAAHGTKEGGFTVVSTIKKDLGTYRGYIMTSKGVANGYECVQSTWYLFTPKGTYIVQTGMMEVSKEATEIAAKMLAGFTFIKEK